jgi:3D (Asp-Asp-Asp) domain-containing protein
VRLRLLVLSASAFSFAPAASAMTAQEHLHHANRTLSAARGTIRFFTNHPHLLYRGPLARRRIAWRETRRAAHRIALAQRERAAAVLKLTPYRSMRVTVTEYAPGCGDSGHGTATGTTPHWGTIAVDPHVIPLGSRLYVSGYGWGRAEDTGGAIDGSHIDAWVPTCGQATTRFNVPIKVY